MKDGRPVLGFFSPVFLFPNDAGGKIRTTNVLRGLKGGAFNVVLASPVREGDEGRWAAELASVCDEFVPWPAPRQRARWERVLDLVSSLPVNVRADVTPAGTRAAKALCERIDLDVVVFDFLHTAALMPQTVAAKSVCFTHNIEAEIFRRHAQTASNPLMRALWKSQYAKMARFERDALRRFDGVVAVSDRDAHHFKTDGGLQSVHTIPTGVDLDYFSWRSPAPAAADIPPEIVFTGSMDWEANRGGVAWFLEKVWHLVLSRVPRARFTVVGRNPPDWLLRIGEKCPGVHFTGFVDDVRPYTQRARAFVIPLLVGGGTRIKAFEAMAMGIPVVSTSLGIEGLPVDDGVHYLKADEPDEMAAALLRALTDDALAADLSRQAREAVERSFGHREVARVFEQACLRVLKRPSDSPLTNSQATLVTES